METLTDTLVDRVNALIQADKAPHEWGSPRVTATPTTVAIAQLATEVAALEAAVREIALEVQRRLDGD